MDQRNKQMRTVCESSKSTLIAEGVDIIRVTYVSTALTTSMSRLRNRCQLAGQLR